ncbi:MAG TPA: hypothetical protein PKE69_06585 [Pyrinomonadaceae bacterium]|nr:hypothetical protein [Pyrinomonadaceae bacterium]
MKIYAKITAVFLPLGVFLLFSACGGNVKTAPPAVEVAPQATAELKPTVTPQKSQIPNLQTELLENKSSQTSAPIGKFDFKNFTYPLPRGWQDADGKDAELVSGKRPLEMTDEVEKIGLSYVTTKFFDATDDGQDEAFVILKIETGGGAIPQIVYVFEWKNDKPELIWKFRTGDRADGGLKNILAENGETIVELFGQDRFILGEIETGKITGDIEQLCCPIFWTRNRYKFNGKDFLLQGKRLTYSMTDKNAPPIENMNEVVERESKR